MMDDPQTTSTRNDGSRWPVRSAHFRLLAALAILLMIVLRVVWIDSDAYPRLSWSSALVTDEGFYIHNARNLVLFGRARMDGFNNMLIMPLLHLIQVGVFRLFGVGVAQVRSISIVTSLMTLILFRDAARRCWGGAVANVATLFLGLDHVNLLYNRLGLMDTPSVLFVVAGWWAAVLGAEARIEAERRQEDAWDIAKVCAWFVFAGLCAVAAYAVRGLAALVVWLPLVYVVCDGRRPTDRSRLSAGAAYALGLMLGLLAYIVLWWAPNRAELAFVNHYYLHSQLLPHNLSRFAYNVGSAFTDWQRGLFPYLFRHTPVQMALALVSMHALARGYLHRRRQNDVAMLRTGQAQTGLAVATKVAMAGWLVLLLLFCCCVDYSPSRYYVLFYPALAALAAVGLTEWTVVAADSARLWFAALGIWAVINMGWYGDWLAHLTYRQRDADRWLAQHLPANSVLLGAWAPGLCLNNRLQAWNIMKDLCNDDHPVERAGDAPAYILILDNGNWNEAWWTQHYPELVAADRRIHAFKRMLRPYFVIGLYPANRQAVSGYKEIQAQRREIER
jgi:4-amino-4-deoxy-L-arabinose transferase-like glycosyltransferase